MSRRSRRCTIRHSVLSFDSDPYLREWFGPDSKMEESTLDSHGSKVNVNLN